MAFPEKFPQQLRFFIQPLTQQSGSFWKRLFAYSSGPERPRALSIKQSRLVPSQTATIMVAPLKAPPSVPSWMILVTVLVVAEEKGKNTSRHCLLTAHLDW